ncbi:MAG TPA: DUF2142 domain-containing protein [Anaeromyxobacteraceae bacterium]|nr:DUF2142 domain-containing protein [Anaeromyxobacteraceae bacterium]
MRRAPAGLRRAQLPALLAVAALVRGAFLAGFVPPFHGPDEPAHMDYVQRIAEHGRLPELRIHCQAYSLEARALWDAAVKPIVFKPDRKLPDLGHPAPDPLDPRSRATTGCGPAATYPPLYYASAVPAYLARADAPFLERLFAVRLVSVAWGAAAVWALYLAGAWWFRSRRAGLLVGILGVVQPMLGFLSSVVNSDAALFACAAASFAALAVARRRPSARGPLVALGIATVAGVLSKPTFSIYLPVLGAACVAALGVRARRSWARAAAAIAPAALTAALWSWYVRPAALEVIANPAGQLSKSGLDLGLRAYLRRFVFDSELFYAIWNRMYWMTWGWVDTNLDPAWYHLLFASVALAGAGVLLGWRTLRARDRGLVVLGAVATAYAIVVMYLLEFLVMRSNGLSFVQGRYLLPLFPVHAAMLLCGYRALGARLSPLLDPAWAFVLTLVVVDLAALMRVLTRFYA